eukprot:1156521-Pelagomonas_calceolata.AAC.6
MPHAPIRTLKDPADMGGWHRGAAGVELLRKYIAWCTHVTTYSKEVEGSFLEAACLSLRRENVRGNESLVREEH